MAVEDADGVAFFRDDPLDERLVRIERVVQHHDVAAPRVADAVDQLVDDQPVLILQRRRHAEPLDTGDLESERHDENGVDRRREQRLDPGHQFLFDLREPAGGGRCGHDLAARIVVTGRQRLDRAAGRYNFSISATNASACGLTGDFRRLLVLHPQNVVPA